MEFRVLGPVEATGPDGPLVTGGRRQRLLLAHLLVRANQLVTTDALIDLLWDEEPPEGARNALQVSISRLRRALGDRVETRESGYAVRVEPGELDLSRFEELVRDGRALVDADPQDAADTLREALDIWRGPAFADLADERSLQGEIARLTELRSLAEEERISSDLALGHHHEVIGELESLTTADPLRERLWGMLMLALYRSGRQADALAAYARARDLLSEQLGIDPSRGLQRLHARILAQDPGLSVATGHAAAASGRETTGDLPAGARIGGYKILDVLGRGGMSVVYLAEHETLHRKVALKLLAPQLSSDERFRDRFVRESQLAASLDHPNVTPIFEAGEAEGYLFIAMRYVDGTDLRKAIRANGALSTERTLSIMRQLAAALDAAHRRGLVHRDVKPGNILIARIDTVGETEQVYLSDFGLTKRASSLSGVTGTGQFIGTLDYAAPEQFLGRRLDARTDVYSLGALLFECLTGHPPFRRDNDASLMHAHLSEPPPSVTDERAELPGSIDVVIARAMAKDPADRYQSAADLVSETSEALKRETAGVLLRTFMIADVRGYTTFTREQGDERAAELAGRFAEIVRGVVSQHGGVLLELRGDEALTVFSSARQAIRAAVALQAACRAAELPRGIGVGLDAGEAVAVEGGYRGAALNLAARLCGKAAPGEVLASEAVTHMAAHVDGVAYTGLRTFDLKGFDEPVRAVRVVTDEELAAMPPTRQTGGRSGIRRRIPVLVAGFVAIALAAVSLPRVFGGASPEPTTFHQGVAIIDQQTHDIVAQVQIQDPVEGYFVDGSFWFLNLEPLSFVQIEANTHRIVGQISSPVASVGSFAVDGPSLWVTDATAPVLWRMDIRTGREAAHYDYSAEGSGGLDGPAVGAGSIWTGVGRKILRVDPSTGDIQERITGEGRDDPLDNPDFRQPAWNFGDVTAMSFGDGALFVPSEERLVKIDPSTDEVVYAAGMPTSAKFVTGGGGFGWATSEAGNSVFQVSPRGYKVGEFSTGEGPESIAFDGDRLWVANYDSASVGWIDVASGTTGSLSVGHPVQGIAAGAGLVAFTVGRGRGVVDRVEALPGDVLRLTFPEQFNTVYDPALATDPGMFQVERATCLKLLNQPVAEAPEGWGLQPEAAEAMPDISADGRTYTFRVRDGYRFSPPSGELVTAETFRYSLERALSPTLGPKAPGPRLIDDIVGEADFRAGREEHISGLVTAGDTLTITLTAPSGDLLQRLAAPYFCPVPSDTPILSGGVESETLASAGPYYATENTPGELLVLQANPNYSGDRRPGVDAIAVRTGLDQGDAVFLVEQGDSDGSIGSLDALYFGAVRDEPGYRIASLPGVRSVVLNANGPVFSDAKVRAAVATAFDRYFSARFWSELPTDELIPPDLAGGAQDPSATLPDRKAAAEQMPDRGGSVTIGVQACPQCLLIARGGFGPGGLVALMGRLGLDAKVELVSRRDIFADPDAFDLLIWENSTDYQDTASYVAATIGGTAPASWYPADLRAEAGRVMRLSGPDRTEAAVALAQRLTSEHIVIPYSLFGRSELLSDQVGCRTYPPMGFGVDLASLCINDRATPSP